MTRFFILFTILLLMVWSTGCDRETPAGLYDPDYQGNPTPVIAAINPPDSTLAGIVQIDIMGENFSPELEKNIVYFDKTKATVLEATKTRLKIQSPNIIKDLLKVKVAVQGALEFSNTVTYKLIQGVGEYGGYGDFDKPYVVACDREENLYVALGSKIVEKVSPRQERVNYGFTSFAIFSSMKLGPDGGLYIARLSKFIYRIPPGGGEAIKHFEIEGKIHDFDFTPTGALYAGGKGDALYLVNPDCTFAVVAEYLDTSIKAVRIFNGYVYVGGREGAAEHTYLWRNRIISEAELAPKEIVFDWSGNVDPTSEILAIAIAEDGDIYLGTDAPETIINVHPDGSHEPLYPGILGPPAYAMSWGNSTFLYMCRYTESPQDRRLIKINMLKKSAPYFGRP